MSKNKESQIDNRPILLKTKNIIFQDKILLSQCHYSSLYPCDCVQLNYLNCYPAEMRPYPTKSGLTISVFTIGMDHCPDVSILRVKGNTHQRLLSIKTSTSIFHVSPHRWRLDACQSAKTSVSFQDKQHFNTFTPRIDTTIPLF